MDHWFIYAWKSRHCNYVKIGITTQYHKEFRKTYMRYIPDPVVMNMWHLDIFNKDEATTIERYAFHLLDSYRIRRERIHNSRSDGEHFKTTYRKCVQAIVLSIMNHYGILDVDALYRKTFEKEHLDEVFNPQKTIVVMYLGSLYELPPDDEGKFGICHTYGNLYDDSIFLRNDKENIRQILHEGWGYVPKKAVLLPISATCETYYDKNDLIIRMS